ncbi:MAG: hypothetical protein IID53_07865 [Proteobacteria bacterium]|nr:hypothetical protein [Pseudomonadota bacterium]
MAHRGQRCKRRSRRRPSPDGACLAAPSGLTQRSSRSGRRGSARRSFPGWRSGFNWGQYIVFIYFWLIGDRFPAIEKIYCPQLKLSPIKCVLNELVAYLDFAALPQGTLTGKSPAIMVYALCGFANFGGLGIIIGGIGAMAPERKGEIVALGIESIVAGTIATRMTGC